MRTLSLSEAKMKLSELVQSVHETEEEVVITKNGSPAAVLISPEEFESWRETFSITADTGFMDEIRTGLAGLQKTKKLYTLAELFDRP
jgi:prevent-host-death family protein